MIILLAACRPLADIGCLSQKEIHKTAAGFFIGGQAKLSSILWEAVAQEKEHTQARQGHPDFV